MSENKNLQEADAEKMEAAGKSVELSPDEMTDAAGGTNMDGAVKSLATYARDYVPPCTNPDGHHWVYSHHIEEENTIFGFIPAGTMGYDYYRCTYCNEMKREHVRP